MGCASSRRGEQGATADKHENVEFIKRGFPNTNEFSAQRDRDRGERATRRRHVQINTHKTGDNEDSGRARLDWQTAKEYEHRVLAVLLH